MSVTNRIATGAAELHQKQLKRSWALIGAIFATLASAFVLSFAVATLFPIRFPGSFLVALATLGAIAGTVSLMSFGLRTRVAASAMWYVALWFGNLAVSAFLLIEPELVSLAVVPIVAGTIIMRKHNQLSAVVFAVLPLTALATSVIAGAVGWGVLK